MPPRRSEAARVTLGTNLFGAMRLTEALWPELSLGDPKECGGKEVAFGHEQLYPLVNQQNYGKSPFLVGKLWKITIF